MALPKPTLEILRDRYERAENLDTCHDIRRQARKLAAATSQAIPNWAKLRRGDASQPATPRESKPRESKPVARADTRALLPKARKPRGESPMVAAPKPKQLRGHDRPIVATIDIPPELRAWARRTEGAIVHIGSNGVALHTLLNVQRFRDVESALAAVA